MRKHKHATYRRSNPRIAVTLLVLAISGVVSIAAYASDNTRDERINEIKRIRQEQITGVRRSENATSIDSAESSRDEYINEIKRIRQEQITGIVFEPWHFRYVGVTIAREIKDTGLCFEEYLMDVTVAILNTP